MIRLLYFASLREALNTENEQLELPHDVKSVTQLKQFLSQRGELWLDAFQGNQPLLVSVNQQMANDESLVRDGDEIAFFPPVTGG